MITKRLERLVGDYMINNPKAENPFDYGYIFSNEEIQKLLILAKNRTIEFKMVLEKKGDVPVFDYIVPTIEGRQIEGFEFELDDDLKLED